jgi:hypothetical protein
MCMDRVEIIKNEEKFNIGLVLKGLEEIGDD